MLDPRLTSSLAAFAFCGFNYLSPVDAQQSGVTPEGRQPLVLKLGSPNCFQQDSGPVELGHLRELASRLLRHAPDAGCHPGACRILVTNSLFPALPFRMVFSGPTNSRPTLPVQEKALQVVNCSLVKNLLQKDQISGMLQNSESAARWQQ